FVFSFYYILRGCGLSLGTALAQAEPYLHCVSGRLRRPHTSVGQGRALMILDQFRLDDQVAVVTGGNRGLGLGMAAALAETGADIVSVQRSADVSMLADRVQAAGRRL